MITGEVSVCHGRLARGSTCHGRMADERCGNGYRWLLVPDYRGLRIVTAWQRVDELPDAPAGVGGWGDLACNGFRIRRGVLDLGGESIDSWTLGPQHTPIWKASVSGYVLSPDLDEQRLLNWAIQQASFRTACSLQHLLCVPKQRWSKSLKRAKELEQTGSNSAKDQAPRPRSEAAAPRQRLIKRGQFDAVARMRCLVGSVCRRQKSPWSSSLARQRHRTRPPFVSEISAASLSSSRQSAKTYSLPVRQGCRIAGAPWRNHPHLEHQTGS